MGSWMQKAIVFLLFVLAPCVMPGMVISGTVFDYGKRWDYDDGLSFKKFTGLVFTQPFRSGTTVYASFFSTEEPGTVIFPPNMTGVTFLRCHLDNIVIPPGNFNVDSNTRTYKVMNDGRDWELDDLMNPKEVLSREYWYTLGYSTDPVDIPLVRGEPRKRP